MDETPAPAPAIPATRAQAAAAGVRHVAPIRPFYWLRRGITDFARQPIISMFYGLSVIVAGVLISFTVARMPYLFTAAASGFLLVAPLLAAGLYALSCGYERGERLRLWPSIMAWRRNPTGLAGFAVFALFAGTAWQVLSLVIMALLYKGEALAPLALIIEVLRNPQHMPLFLSYMIVGGVVASMVFALSVVSVPMLLDRRCEVIDAMRISLAVVSENPLPLAIWAIIIMCMCALGFASAMIGFIVVMPILGHASWHAYRELVERGRTATGPDRRA